MENKSALHNLMEANLARGRTNPDIVKRFEHWMLTNASHIIIDKRTMDFETNTPHNQRLLQRYADTCPEFDFN
jgi:hypothetical protein